MISIRCWLLGHKWDLHRVTLHYFDAHRQKGRMVGRRYVFPCSICGRKNSLRKTAFDKLAVKHGLVFR